MEACGVRVDDPLRRAWEFLVAELGDEAVDARTIADLLSYSDHTALGSDTLANSGYGTTDAVVDVLRTLGVLVTDTDGRLRLEPVVAAAAATAKAPRE